jgi:hypothetical protein
MFVINIPSVFRVSFSFLIMFAAGKRSDRTQLSGSVCVRPVVSDRCANIANSVIEALCYKSRGRGFENR